jgi:putative tryptophan/tyrosine transport system substrate-binding protein
MRRRDFITLGGAVVAWPIAGRAQQPPVPVIGFLHSGSPQADILTAFGQGLHEVGYVEGQNLAIEYRWAHDQFDQLPGLAADLVRREVAVIFAGALPAAIAAKSATATIPIVFLIGGDPVTVGLVTSLSRPIGNVTGVTVFSGTLLAKRLELLHELVPTAALIAVLVNPNNPNAETRSRDVHEAASAIGQQIQILSVSSARDFVPAFTTIVHQRAGALLVGDDPLFSSHRRELVTLAARHEVPTIYFQREFVAAGGLISYATKYSDAYRQLGVYTGRVLRGSKPADLPVLQPTKFELVINLKTAKALGLEVLPTLLVRADEVIE